MTEDEAKTKWCPFARITLENNGWKAMTNRDELLAGPGGASTCCIASVCMAWRWGTRAFVMVPTSNLRLTVEPERPADVPAEWEWHPYQADGPAGWCGPRGGYCGLAEEPRA